MIINVKSKQPFDVYIGRKNDYYQLPQSKWANPFIISKDGNRENVILKYRLWLDSQPDLLESIHVKRELDDKSLGCWCDVNKESCHGQILEDKIESKWMDNWFSNMKPMTPLYYQGVEYLTSENFYQAMKLPKKEVSLRKEIANMSPKKAKISIRNKERFKWDLEWNDEKALKVMEYILKHKFHIGTEEAYLLDLTEDWELVEWNTWGDIKWGKNLVTRQGQNYLGKILMKIREENRKNIEKHES